MAAIQTPLLDLAALQRIRLSARARAKKYSSHAPPAASSPNTSTIPKLILRDPESLESQLLSLGVDAGYARRISAAVLRATWRFKESCQSSAERRREWAQTQAQYYQDPKALFAINATYTSLYNKLVDNWALYILHDFTPRFIRAHRLYQRSRSPHHKRPFNHSAVPTLEDAFHDNAFPSRLKKYDLAAKCAMEYRQIHVWFQNRRSRSRKEGKELKRRPTNTFIDELENSVVDSMLPDDDDSADDLTTGPSYDTHRGSQVSPSFNLDGPLHAYPSPYPPQCEYDPFPIAEGKRAFQTPWIRPQRARTADADSSKTADVASLSALFAKLNITDSPVENKTVSASHPRFRRQSGCSSSRLHLGFITPCARAPHPALIRRTTRGQRPICHSQRTSALSDLWRPGQFDRRPLAQSPIYDTPSSSAKHRTVEGVSSALCTAAVRQPKRALPRRLPKNSPVQRPPTLHTPQFLPQVRSPSCTSLSSASGSDIDSPLSTPPLLPQSDFVHPNILDLGWEPSALLLSDAALTQDTYLSFLPLISLKSEDHADPSDRIILPSIAEP